MKFKLIFALFNIVIVVSFLVIYLMPLFMLGWEYTRAFWSSNWGLPLIFLAIIGALNGYFVFNWRLFQLLEREDWGALAGHLEHRIYHRKIILAQQVRILVNAYLVRSDLSAVGKLEAFVREHRAKMLPRVALVLGIPHLLRNDGEAMERYFGEFAESTVRDRYWLRWCLAFSHVLVRKQQRAVEILEGLANRVREPVLLLLCAYLLDSSRPGEDQPGSAVTGAKNALKKRYSSSSLAEEVERSKNHVQVVILSRLIEDASDWLFRDAVQEASDSGDAIH